jgi:hypothetical protein
MGMEMGYFVACVRVVSWLSRFLVFVGSGAGEGERGNHGRLGILSRAGLNLESGVGYVCG